MSSHVPNSDPTPSQAPLSPPEVAPAVAAAPVAAAPLPPQQQQQQQAGASFTGWDSSPRPEDEQHHHRYSGAVPVQSPPPPPPASGPVQLQSLLDDIFRLEEEGFGTVGGASITNTSDPQQLQSQLQQQGDIQLNELVALLVDPKARDVVERIPLSTFISMQPTRQLIALNHRRPWWEWIVNSSAYKSMAATAAHRSSSDSTVSSLKNDRRLLKEAGLVTLQDWVSHVFAVPPLSARGRALLDRAVSSTVTQHVAEVMNVVRVARTHRHLLREWLSDVVGKFVLDSLQVSLESAAQAVKGARREYRSSSRGGGEGEQALFGSLSSPSAPPPSSLRPGVCCTVEHYLLFLQKVTNSVRQELQAERQSSRKGTSSSGSSASVKIDEWELNERSQAVIHTAFSQLFQHAAVHHLPVELRELEAGGLLALERVPGLLQRAASQLQLRTLPVGSFVVHSTAKQGGGEEGGDADGAAAGEGGSVDLLRSLSQVSGGAPAAALRLSTAGAFLNDEEDPDIPLAEWRRPQQRAHHQTASSSSSSSHESNRSGRRVTLYDGEPLQEAYYSLLNRLQSSLQRLSLTSIDELLDAADSSCGCPSSTVGHAAVGACLRSPVGGIYGDEPLFGACRVVEDRLCTAVSSPASASERPPLFTIEAGPISGKTALLEKVQQRLAPRLSSVVPSPSVHGASPSAAAAAASARRSRYTGGAALVRYCSAPTPFIADLDDHPAAFGSRLWFRVALSLLPYFIRQDVLFSSAPSAPLWWAATLQGQWSFATVMDAIPRRWRPSCILIDDVHRVLDGLESRWASVLFSTSGEPVPASEVKEAFATALRLEEEEEAEAAAAGQKEQQHAPLSEPSQRSKTLMALRRLLASSQTIMEMPNIRNESGANAPGGAGGSDVSPQHQRLSASLLVASRRQEAVEQLQQRTGITLVELLRTNMEGLTAGGTRGTHLVLAGQRISALLQAYTSGTWIRQFYLSTLSPGSTGWQQRLRVLPPLSVLHALHRRAGLELPGVLYEAVKNSPALIGATIESLWDASGGGNSISAALSACSSSALDRQQQMLQLGRVGSSAVRPSGSSQYAPHGLQHTLLRHYDPQNLFVELPLRNKLFCYPLYAKRRLVRLLQQQLLSPSGFLSMTAATMSSSSGTGSASTSAISGPTPSGEVVGDDVTMGLVTPHTHSLAFVHPFVLFLLFSSPTATTAAAAEEGGDPLVRLLSVLFAEYQTVVRHMATTPSRKHAGLQVLLFAALTLRGAALSGRVAAGGVEEMDRQLPPYGFPLLSSPIRVRVKAEKRKYRPYRMLQRHAPLPEGVVVREAVSSTTVSQAVTAYQHFFSQLMAESEQNSHFVFRPVHQLNEGCEVISVEGGTTLCLYDVLVSTHHIVSTITSRLAFALLGLIHAYHSHVIPAAIKKVQYITVVCSDLEEEPVYYRSSATPSGSRSSSRAQRALAVTPSQEDPETAAGNTSRTSLYGALSGGEPSGAATPSTLDYSALLDDDTMDLLEQHKEVLQLTTSSPFRTLQDLLDALEQVQVSFTQRIVGTYEEMEGLLSPTLLQLVPDGMLLPPYAPELVSSDDLMKEVLAQDQESPMVNERDEPFYMPPVGEEGSAAAAAAGVEGSAWPTGAEAEDMLFYQPPPAAGSQPSAATPAVADDPYHADVEHHYESTDLLEAMLNEDYGEADVASAPTPNAANNSVPSQSHPGAPPPPAAAAAVDSSRGDQSNAFSWLTRAIPTGAAAAEGGAGAPVFPPEAGHSTASSASPPAEDALHAGGYNRVAYPDEQQDNDGGAEEEELEEVEEEVLEEQQRQLTREEEEEAAAAAEQFDDETDSSTDHSPATTPSRGGPRRSSAYEAEATFLEQFLADERRRRLGKNGRQHSRASRSRKVRRPASRSSSSSSSSAGSRGGAKKPAAKRPSPRKSSSSVKNKRSSASSRSASLRRRPSSQKKKKSTRK